MASPLNGTTQIQNGIAKGEIFGLVLGSVMFAIAIYSFTLSIKANRLAIKKFEADGIK